MCKDIFISVAEEFEDRQRIKAGEATCIRDEMRILSAMHDVLKEFEAMYWNTFARAQGYGSPRFASEAEMRAYYDKPMPVEYFELCYKIGLKLKSIRLKIESLS